MASTLPLALQHLLARIGPLALMGLLAGLAADPSRSGTVQAVVVSISDGDSLRMQLAGRQLRVRLACIDAPELTQNPWGQQARQALQRRLPPGQTVTLKVKTRDHYGRTVAEVIHTGNIGLELVADGQAFADRQLLAQCDGQRYLEAAERARRRRAGVWQVSGGITRPWEVRRRRP